MKKLSLISFVLIVFAFLNVCGQDLRYKISQSSSTIVELSENINHISSDFGRRNPPSGTRWHVGIDVNPQNGDPDLGAPIYPISVGEINQLFIKISDNDRKTVCIGFQDNNDWGIIHLFESYSGDEFPSGGLECGDFILKFQDPPNFQEEYAIIYNPLSGDPVAFGVVTGTVTHPDVNNGEPISVCNQLIDINTPFAPIGKSGTSNAHIHLYLFENPPTVQDFTSGEAGLQTHRCRNQKDPIFVLDVLDTEHDITIEEITNLTEYGTQVFFPGTALGSVKIKCEMKNGGNGTTYDNVIMDMNTIELFIKNEFCPTELPEVWGGQNSKYQLIKGPNFESKISHGATFDTERYPSINYPENNATIDIATYSRIASNSTTGIEPHAYDDHPWDYYYLSDIRTRIHKDDNFGHDNGYLSAVRNFDARYPDGNYELWVKGTTVRKDNNNEYFYFYNDEDDEDPVSIIIDNFAPFIKEVKIYNNEEMLNNHRIYGREWFWQDNEYNLGSAIQGTITTDDNLWIVITSSEAMASLTLDINGQQVTDPVISDDNYTWIFNFGNLQVGDYHLSINGADLNNNNLQPGGNPVRIRNGSNQDDFNPPKDDGPDKNHMFSVTEPVHVNFTTAQNPFVNYAVYFTSISDFTNISLYEWDFGDGFSSSSETEPNIEHVYWNDGIYLVKHKIHTSSGVFYVEKIVEVIELTDPLADFYPSLINNNAYRSDEYKLFLFDNSEGIIGQWIWSMNGEIIHQTTDYEDRNPTEQTPDFSNGPCEVTLEVVNDINTSIKTLDIDPTQFPILYLYDWEQSYCSRDFELIVDNVEGGPYTFKIDYGDGSSEVLANQLSYWVNFDHQYYIPGTYLVTATVEYEDELGYIQTTGTAREIEINYYELDVDVSYESDNDPPFPLSNVEFSVNVTPSVGIYFWADWKILKQGNPDGLVILQKNGNSTSDLNITHQFSESGVYNIQVNVYDENARTGVDEFNLSVINAPDYIHAGICCGSGDMYACKDAKRTFEATLESGPIGNPGVSEDKWYPTHQRWTILQYDEDNNEIPVEVIYDPDGFSYQDYIFVPNRSATFDFSQQIYELGDYYVRFEYWNNTHGYASHDLLHPKYANTICFYDFEERLIHVQDLATLKLILPEPANNNLVFDANLNNYNIKFTNPSSACINWELEAEDFETGQPPDWISLTYNLYSEICNSVEEYIDVSIDPWDDIGERRAWIKVSSDEVSPESGQTVFWVFIKQYGIQGPPEQFIYADNSFSGQRFGSSTSIYKDILAVGAPSYSGSWAHGAVFIFERDNVGTWQQSAKLIPFNEDNRWNFGNDIEIFEDYVIAGNSNKEKAFIFKKPVGGWSGTIHELVILENNGSDNDNFGHSVTIWGDYAAVGSPYNDSQGNDAGKVQIYYRNQNDITDSWGRMATIHDCSQDDNFGYDVDIYNDVLAVGAPQYGDYWGFIKMYKRNLDSGNDWGLFDELYANEITHTYNYHNAKFGKTVCIYDRYLTTLFFMPYNNPFYHGPHLTSIFYQYESQRWPELDWPEEIDEQLYPIIDATDNPVDATTMYLDSDHNFQPIHGMSSTYSDRGFLYYPHFAQYYDACYDYTAGDLNGKSVFGDYNYYGRGIPGLDNPEGNLDYTGSVLVLNDIQNSPYKTLCQASMNLTLENFVKPQGIYPTTEARNLTLGGGGYQALVEDGAEINYEGYNIKLLPGFKAEDGSMVNIKAYECQSTQDNAFNMVDYLASFGDYNYGAVPNESEINIEISLIDIYRYLQHLYRSYPWSSINPYTDITKVELINNNYEVIDQIKRPHPVNCGFDMERSKRDQYAVLIYFGERIFKVQI